MRVLFAAGVAGLLFLCPAVAADFAASYDVAGSNPGGGEYSGTVAVRRTGQVTYEVVWNVGGDRYVGTAIGGTDGLAISYKAGGNTGVAIYGAGENGEINGFWTYAGGTDVGKETWTPR